MSTEKGDIFGGQKKNDIKSHAFFIFDLQLKGK
jgi:hypothetical protein